MVLVVAVVVLLDLQPRKERNGENYFKTPLKIKVVPAVDGLVERAGHIAEDVDPAPASTEVVNCLVDSSII